MELIRADQIPALSNPGVVSRQLLNPESAPDARVTVTEVHLSPDGVQPRHIHERAEQIWYALRGRCALLLALGEETPFHAGDVVRFAPGDVHGAALSTPTRRRRAAHRARCCPGGPYGKLIIQKLRGSDCRAVFSYRKGLVHSY